MHPDLYELDALGEMIRIDAIRELRRDLHMRPFEADRRVYLILSAHLMNEDAADALLKDLEEPPAYAVIVLVADDLGPIPETIRSRCQLVPFTRLSERAIREAIDARAPELDEARRVALARVAGGRLDRLARLLDPRGGAAARGAARAGSRGLPRAGLRAGGRRGGARSSASRERGAEAKAARGGEGARARAAGAGGRAARAPRAARRRAGGAAGAARGARRPGTATWSSSASAPRRRRSTSTCSRSSARDATRERLLGAERAAEAVRETWRRLEEFNLAPQLALEALFVAGRRASSQRRARTAARLA